MKYKLLFIVFFISFISFGQSFTATYPFTSVVNSVSGQTDPTPVPAATGVTFGSFSAVGTPLNPNAGGRFSFTNWDLGAINLSDTFTGAINTGKYYQVTITPQAGYTLDLASITFTLQRSGTGVRQYAVRSSLDYTTNLSASINPTNANLQVVPTNVFQVTDPTTGVTTGSTITLGGTAYTAISAPMTFRFYGWNAELAGGTFSIDNVVINGSVTSLTPPVLVIADNSSQISAANVPQGSVNHVISTFQTTVSDAWATVTAASFTTSGNYQASDILASGLKLWYNSINNFSTATQVGAGFTSAATGLGETISFSSLNQSVPIGTGYFWLTTSLTDSAIPGRTIMLNAISSSNITLSFGSKSGSATAGGTQTITIVAPNTPTSLTKGCTTNTSQVLNWAAPTTGSYDGYLLVVRQGGVPNAVTSIYVPTQTTNLDYSIAPTYNASSSRGLYSSGTASTVSVTVTGLTAGLSYTFAVYAYKNNGASTLFSATATTTTQTIGVPTISNAVTTAGNTTASLTWSNPTAACFDQVLVVVTSASGITFVPTGGSNSSYTPNVAFTSFNQAVYYSSGNLGTISGLTNGVTYYLELFVRNGDEWSSGVEVSVTPLNINPTQLKTGDLALIAYNNNFSSSANDAIRLLTFVDINPGTKFLWTNGTYETGGKPAANIRTDKWFDCTTTPTGNIPYLEFTYSGATVIPAASTFCIETVSVGTGSTITSVTPSGTVIPNTSFSIICKSADGSTGLSHGIVNVSTSAPDAMFLLQGNFIYNVTGSTFVGTVLSGLQDGGLLYDLADNLSAITADNLRRSRKHPKLLCTSMQANTTPASYQVSYDVSVVPGNTSGTKPYLLTQIFNFTTNWVNTIGSCPAISPFVINTSDTFNRWTGSISTNWFDCNNWAQLSVPDEFTDVKVFSTSARDVVIDYTASFSDSFFDIAKTRNFTISGRKVQLEANANNKLEVYGDLLINTTGILDMDDSNSGTVDGNLYLYKNFTNSIGTANFLEGTGTVSFVGSLPQIINANTHANPEEFFNVVLDNDFNTTISNNLIASGDLEVRTNKYVTIGSAAYPSDYIRVNNRLTNSGDITIETGGQLIQVNDTDTNNGDYSGTKFTVKRDYTAKDIDYVYWSTPTKLFAVSSIPNGYRYEWNPVFPNSNGTFGNWITPSTTNMTAGKGYIARTFNGSNTSATNNFSFRGQPNNGALSIPISRASFSGLDYDAEPSNPFNSLTTKWDDNWNLVGNPYPSAINSLTFLNAIDNPNIEGFVYLWTHGTAPSSALSDPFYTDFTSNYSEDDYIVYNGTGPTSGPVGFNGMIASGQGFFVLMKDGPAASSVVNFNNSMRRNTSSNAIYNNTQFYRNASEYESVIGEEEKSRIWLDIVSSQNSVKRTLIGYLEAATNEKDRLFDALTIPTSLDIYSFVDNEIRQEYCIQGRGLPFLESDAVKLGIKVATTGNYNIAIAAVDGLFEQGQPIYLEDKALNSIHDLRQSPYSFTTNLGVYNDRFVLRYTNQVLGNPNLENLENSVVIAANKGEMTIKSYIENIDEVTVFDVLGRQLFFAKTISNNSFTTSNITLSQQTLIVKIKLENGITISRKIIL